MVSAALTPATQLFRDRLQLIPERCVARIAVVFGWCRLCDAHRVRRRERIDQTGLKLRMFFPIDGRGFLGIGGVLVEWRGIKFLYHLSFPWQANAPLTKSFPRDEGNRLA